MIAHEPHPSVNIIVTIPCFNEPNLNETLLSLANTKAHTGKAEVIVLINNAQDAEKHLVEQNLKTYSESIEFCKRATVEHLRFQIIYVSDFPQKHAGVGLARKTAMDEAVRRFAQIRNPHGIITGLDADCTVSDNYFLEIEKHFTEHPQSNCCSIHFEHPLVGDIFHSTQYQAITNYELHLRYFKHALAYTDFPYGYYTVGSSFAVRAETYAEQGGMNKKKAGEDFYFLQKIIALGKFSELKSATVYPSPRESDRVPFGTGAAIKKILTSDKTDYYTYNFAAFELLKDFYTKIPNLYYSPQSVKIHEILDRYLHKTDFYENLEKIRNNSTDIEIFTKHFVRIFNAFSIIRFLNDTRSDSTFPEVEITEATRILLSKLNHTYNTPTDFSSILKYFRKIDTST